jgi:hypothetical protein
MCYGLLSRSFDEVAIHIQRHFLQLLSVSWQFAAT